MCKYFAQYVEAVFFCVGWRITRENTHMGSNQVHLFFFSKSSYLSVKMWKLWLPGTWPAGSEHTCFSKRPRRAWTLFPVLIILILSCHGHALYCLYFLSWEDQLVDLQFMSFLSLAIRSPYHSSRWSRMMISFDDLLMKIWCPPLNLNMCCDTFDQ